jgi:hypothetical protein
VEQHLVGVGAGGGVGSGAGAGEDLEAAVLGARHRLRRRLSQSSASAAARVRFWEAWSGTGRAVRWWPCPALLRSFRALFACAAGSPPARRFYISDTPLWCLRSAAFSFSPLVSFHFLGELKCQIGFTIRPVFL